jgi:hypothetical protein
MTGDCRSWMCLAVTAESLWLGTTITGTSLPVSLALRAQDCTGLATPVFICVSGRRVVLPRYFKDPHP